jgi:hypothetical protein
MLLQRPFPHLNAERTIIYFSVEGEKTERLYFEALESGFESAGIRPFTPIVDGPDRASVGSIPVVGGGRSSPLDVLSRAKVFQCLHSYANPSRMWLVMDMDSQHVQHLYDMLEDVRAAGFMLGISNPCFELWLWLHDNDVDPRHSNCQDINAACRFESRTCVTGYYGEAVARCSGNPNRIVIRPSWACQGAAKRMSAGDAPFTLSSE